MLRNKFSDNSWREIIRRTENIQQPIKTNNNNKQIQMQKRKEKTIKWEKEQENRKKLDREPINLLYIQVRHKFLQLLNV